MPRHLFLSLYLFTIFQFFFHQIPNAFCFEYLKCKDMDINSKIKWFWKLICCRKYFIHLSIRVRLKVIL